MELVRDLTTFYEATVPSVERLQCTGTVGPFAPVHRQRQQRPGRPPTSGSLTPFRKANTTTPSLAPSSACAADLLIWGSEILVS